jgi:hypothetical protein
LLYSESLGIFTPAIGELVRKIVVIGCPHHPYMNWELFREIIEESRSDADLCVVNGDILDQYLYSLFVQNRNITFLEEYTQALDMLEELSRAFPRVMLNMGNHDSRLAKRLGKMRSGLAETIRALAKTSQLAPGGVFLEPLSKGMEFNLDGEAIGARGFENIFFQRGAQAWWCRVGKAVICHPEKGSAVSMKAVQEWHRKYFAPRYAGEYDAVVMHHTHKGGKIVDGNVLLIEGGCICDPLPYAVEGRTTYDSAHLGYALLFQDAEGNTDFDSSRFVFKGIGVEPDPPLSFDEVEECGSGDTE